MDTLPLAITIIVNAHMQILSPFGYDEFSVERDADKVFVTASTTPRGASYATCFYDDELRATRSPFALVASRLAKFGFNVPEVA